jgi:nucleoside-diphosphate-sugar epimerase
VSLWWLCAKNSFALTQTIKEVAMKIVITGGTGMLGHALTRAFTAAGDEVVILTRRLTHAKQLPQGAPADAYRV